MNPNTDLGDDGAIGSELAVDDFGVKQHYYEGDFTGTGKAYGSINTNFSNELLVSYKDANYKGLYNRNISAWHMMAQPSGDSTMKSAYFLHY